MGRATGALPVPVLYLSAGILKPAFEGVGPSWFHEELGIVVTGAICLVGGVLLARKVSQEPGRARL
jgi:hypothetical protein